MEPQNNPNPAKLARFKRFNKQTLIVFGLVLIIVVSPTLYFVFRAPQPNHYHYSGFNTYQIAGIPKKHTGMSFQKPPEISFVKAPLSNVAIFTNTPSGQSSATLIVATTPNSKQAISGPTLKAFDDIAARHSGQAYSILISGYKKIVSTWFQHPPSSLSLGTAQLFKSSYIKSHAWTFSIQASDQSSGRQYQGLFLTASSSKGYYYLLILAPDYNWQPNLTIWQKVLSSVKIDQ